MKIVFLDLDFTLLNSQRNVTEKSIRVLDEFRRRGNMVVFATSRGVTNIGDLIEKVRPDVVISNGGATVHRGNEIIYSPSFSLEETREILKNCYETFGDDVEITIDTKDNLFWNRNGEETRFYAPDAAFDDMRDFRLPAVKICVKTVDLDRVKEIACKVCDVDCLRFSDIPWCKISTVKATKAEAVKFVGNYFGVDVKDMFAFGDDFSDIGMLSVCGTGVAMENAIGEVKAVADIVCGSCDEDGVACWIEENLLK